MKKFLVFSCAVLLVFAAVAEAQATTMYTYTGNNYTWTGNDQYASYPGAYSVSMSVSGSFTLSSPVPALSTSFDASALATSWTMFDGRNTLTSASSNLNDLLFSTDSLGNVTEWKAYSNRSFVATSVGHATGFNIRTVSMAGMGVNDVGQIFACTSLDASGQCQGAGLADEGHVFGKPGAWIITGDLPAPVPEPSTMLLIGTGLLGLVGLRRKFKS